MSLQLERNNLIILRQDYIDDKLCKIINYDPVYKLYNICELNDDRFDLGWYSQKNKDYELISVTNSEAMQHVLERL